MNERKSVSFYSRSFFQEEVVSGEFLKKNLKNGDTPVLFKRKDIVSFFRNIDSFFGKPTNDSTSRYGIPSNGKILKITDNGLLKKLRPLLDTETPHTLEAIKITQQYYGNLPEMKFRDWANLIKTVKFENESNGSSICSNL